MNEKGDNIMKIWSVFSVVILFHVAILGLLLIQPGCQTSKQEAPDPSLTASSRAPAQPAPARETALDPAFNSGIAQPAATSGRSLSAPTRPTGTTRTTPDTGVLQPVLEPVQDSLSLPAASREYTVAKGDTLSGIARKQGVSLNDLLAANGLSRSATIYVGQVLLVPAPRSTDQTASPEIEHAGREYVVAKGDTLSGIAARAGVSVKTLKSLNGLTSDTIFVGQKLALPESAGSISTPLSAPPPAAAATPLPVAGGSSYTVKTGDTPSGIARKFGITSAQLMAANNISDPRKLFVGQVLVIPQGGSSATSRPDTTRSEPVTTGLTPPSQPPPSSEDPMSVLEALEDEDLPFVEVEAVDQPVQPGN